MRTVRSAARTRNQPRGALAVLVVAIVVALSVMAARADAGPADDGGRYSERGEPEERDERIDSGAEEDVPEVHERRPRLYVPLTPAMVERIVTVAPPIASVIDAAYRAAGLGEDPTPGWRTRSRLSSLIPLISMRAGQNQSWREVSDPTISRGIGLDVRASWHLDRLLFDPNETRIAMLDVARRREKRRIASQAIDVYFAWVAARAAADRDVAAVLDAAAKTAELDALTAGWFSQALAKRAELR